MADPVTIIAGIGLATAAIGSAVQYEGTVQQSEASQKAERLRQQQMNLDAYRKRREVVRQMILAQATGKANAASQGASVTGDSAVIGGSQQAASTSGVNQTDIAQSQGIGNKLFQANADFAAGQITSSWGSNIQQAGGGIMQNSDVISRVGASAGLWSK